MLRLYRVLTALLAPLIALWLHWRKRVGKEDPARLPERFGHASRARPEGPLLWIHAASVGESASVLPLLEKLRARFTTLTLLVTTGTVTSARLMTQRLPEGVIHQFVPVDTPAATARFIVHWRPDIALWVESEFWPNLICAARAGGAVMSVINARMSQRSMRVWRMLPGMIRPMLGCFDRCFAQSQADAKRLRMLGARRAELMTNLKLDAPALPADYKALEHLRGEIKNRPLWLAASTHPGEEAMIALAHSTLAHAHPGLLTIVVPRHPPRGNQVARALADTAGVALRSQRQPILPSTAFYVADTLGELGLFYRLCPVVLMGGSLAPHGGQNPLEPARLGCAVVTGPHTHNFADIYAQMEAREACLRITSAEALAGTVGRLLQYPAQLHAIAQRAKIWVDELPSASDQLLETLAPIIGQRLMAYHAHP